MVSENQSKAIHAAEVARQTAPDKKCGRLIAHHKDGTPFYCPQVVKIGTICPACGVRVDQ